MNEVLMWGTLGLALGLVIWTVRCVGAAIQTEHLLLLRSCTHGIWLFERNARGVYERIPLVDAPAAVVRFVRWSHSRRLVPVRQQIVQRSARLRTPPLAGAR
jgi:hypothetical protein